MRRFQLGVTLLGAVLCAVLCGSGAAAANAAWFQAEGPLSKTGFTPGSLPTGAAVVWKFGLTVAAPTTALVSADAQTVYFGDSTGRVSCYSVNTRRQYMQRFHLSYPEKPSLKWVSHNVSGTISTNPAISDDGEVLFYATSEYANAIWTANGTAAWAKPFPIGGTIAGVSSDVTFYNGTVSFGTESGAFFVLDAASGELFDAFSQINANSKIQGAVSVDTATSTLYFTSQGETVYRVSLDLKRRQVQEHIPYSLGSIISTTPVVDVANRGLLVTTHGGLRVSGSLYRIDLDFGSISTLYSTPGPLYTAPVLASPSQVVIADSTGNIVCLDPSSNGTATAIWTASLGSTPTSAGITDGKVVVFGSRTGAIKAYSVSSGDEEWNINMGATVGSTPSYANGQVLASTTEGMFVLIADSGAIYLDVIAGAFVVIGAVVAVAGYRFYVPTLILLSFLGFFPAIFVALSHFVHSLVAWKLVAISGGAALALAVLLGFVRVFGPTYFMLLFCLFTVNNVLLCMELTYESLGYYLIAVEVGAWIVFLPASFAKGLKKACCIIGIAAVAATAVVDGALFYTPYLSFEYVAISYGGVFFVSIIAQALTGRGQYHLSKKAQEEYKRDEALRRRAPSSHSHDQYHALHDDPAVDEEYGGRGGVSFSDGRPSAFSGASGPRRQSDVAFDVGDRFQGNEFDLGPSFNPSLNGSSVPVLPGQRAMAHDSMYAASGGARDQPYTVTFKKGKLGMGLTVPHNPLDSPSCAVVKHVARSGQAAKLGVRAGDFVVRIGGVNTPATVSYDRVMAMLKPPIVRFPLQVTLVRAPRGSMALETEEPSESSGFLGGW